MKTYQRISFDDQLCLSFVCFVFVYHNKGISSICEVKVTFVFEHHPPVCVVTPTPYLWQFDQPISYLTNTQYLGHVVWGDSRTSVTSEGGEETCAIILRRQPCVCG